MKVSHNWLQQYLKIDVPLEKQLELLTDLGLEVEGTTPFESVKGSLKGVLFCALIPSNGASKMTSFPMFS